MFVFIAIRLPPSRGDPRRRHAGAGHLRPDPARFAGGLRDPVGGERRGGAPGDAFTDRRKCWKNKVPLPMRDLNPLILPLTNPEREKTNQNDFLLYFSLFVLFLTCYPHQVNHSF